jgi:hypothetical protein
LEISYGTRDAPSEPGHLANRFEMQETLQKMG